MFNLMEILKGQQEGVCLFSISASALLFASFLLPFLAPRLAIGQGETSGQKLQIYRCSSVWPSGCLSSRVLCSGREDVVRGREIEPTWVLTFPQTSRLLIPPQKPGRSRASSHDMKSCVMGRSGLLRKMCQRSENGNVSVIYHRAQCRIECKNHLCRFRDSPYIIFTQFYTPPHFFTCRLLRLREHPWAVCSRTNNLQEGVVGCSPWACTGMKVQIP